MTDQPQTLEEKIIGIVAVLAIAGGFAWWWHADQESHQHDLRVCAAEESMYGRQTDECRHMLAEEAVKQSEAWEAKQQKAK